MIKAFLALCMFLFSQAAMAQSVAQCGTAGDTVGNAKREYYADMATVECLRDRDEHAENMTALSNGAVGAGLTTVYTKTGTLVTGTATGESYVRTSRGTVQAIGKKTAPTAALVEGGVTTLHDGRPDVVTLSNYYSGSPASESTEFLRKQDSASSPRSSKGGGNVAPPDDGGKVSADKKTTPPPVGNPRERYTEGREVAAEL